MKKWDVTVVTRDYNDTTTVEADSMEIDYYGTLIFHRRDETSRLIIVRAFAHGAWTEVERTP